jgi:hypothetical protein
MRKRNFVEIFVQNLCRTIKTASSKRTGPSFVYNGAFIFDLFLNPFLPNGEKEKSDAV